jgi:AmmeMemoRadiSam system protein B
MARVRRPAVAGTFYPGAPRALEDAVRGFLGAATGSADPAPKALIAPHAGYVYSGPVAASAYARIAARTAEIRRVVLLGPAHRFRLRGLAAPEAEVFETPLGAVRIDRAALEPVLALPQVVASDAAHAREHSLEVHLPFLQLLLGDFGLVPLVVGDAAAEEVEQVIDLLWGGSETLIVVSTDLSHYHDYATAKRIDTETTRAVEICAAESIDSEQACGYVPLQGLLLRARNHGLSVRAVDVRNSGDTAGSRDSVVGYGSFVVG